MCGDYERAMKVFNYDPDTGALTRKNGKKCGWAHGAGYISVSMGNRKYLAHRIAWLMHYGDWPKNDIDHINGDKQDNRINNLRDVTEVINLHNVPRANRDNKTSGLRGVHKHSQGRWASQITVNKKVYHIGLFDTPDDARTAYLAKKKELVGG